MIGSKKYKKYTHKRQGGNKETKMKTNYKYRTIICAKQVNRYRPITEKYIKTTEEENGERKNTEDNES
jgi:hypothetical protein